VSVVTAATLRPGGERVLNILAGHTLA
jgi:hypothetical protein